MLKINEVGFLNERIDNEGAHIFTRHKKTLNKQSSQAQSLKPIPVHNDKIFGIIVHAGISI